MRVIGIVQFCCRDICRLSNYKIRAPRREPYSGSPYRQITYYISAAGILFPEVVGKTASAAANYFVSKGYCLSEASLAFVEIIPREKR